HRLHDGANASEIDRSAETLFARSAVNKNCRYPDVLQRARQIRSGQVLIVPPKTHLGRDRNFHRVHHAANELRGLVELSHHGRATADLADFADWTTHVDVDRSDADRFQVDRGIAHFFRHRTEELDREWSIEGASFDQLQSFITFFEERTRVD